MHANFVVTSGPQLFGAQVLPPVTALALCTSVLQPWRGPTDASPLMLQPWSAPLLGLGVATSSTSCPPPS